MEVHTCIFQEGNYILAFSNPQLFLHLKMQHHIIFSRGFDCTETYGSSPLQGNLTPFIHKAFCSTTTSCILDCEVVIYSSQLNCIGKN